MSDLDVMYDVRYDVDGGSDRLFSYQILSFNHGWKLGDKTDITTGLFPQIESQKQLSMKVLRHEVNLSGIEGLRDAHMNKVPVDMRIFLSGGRRKGEALLVYAELRLSGVLVKQVHPIREVSTAFEKTPYAGKSAYLFSLQAEAAKAIVSTMPNVNFVGEVMGWG